MPCQGKGQGYGPYDYTKAHERSQLPIVESYHFTPEVENLIKGKSGNIPGDLDYTLRAAPNHHRALLSIIHYQIKLNSKLLSNSNPLETPVECYMQRAIHFSPSDAVSYSLYGYYLAKINKLETAVKYYNKAISLSPDNAKIAYSFGLLLLELKRYEDALKYANIAYQNKQTPKGLKQKLEKLGFFITPSTNSTFIDSTLNFHTDTNEPD